MESTENHIPVPEEGGGEPVRKATIPLDGLKGLKQNWRADLLSGFLVFLIALPLCLGISMASGFPPFSGVLTAIIGGMVVSLFMGARVSIKGPAAGLIVIALGAVEELGRGDAQKGYALALAVGVVAAVIQIAFGVLKTGKLGDFFPSSAVHGMLAAIGIIIASKQIHVALGVKPQGTEPLHLIAEIPHSIAHANAEIAIIGLSSLIILFTWPKIAPNIAKYFPGPMLVLVVGIALGYVFDLEHEHQFASILGIHGTVGPKYLVAVPDNLLSVVHFPDFSQVVSGTSIKFIVMFALVGSLESLLSAKAVDTLDVYRRKSDMNKDLVATGVGNLLACMLGGLPMITEIVRSSANITNGAKTRWANFFHGLSLLVFIALVPGLVHRIPLGALAAMLIYTGFRLASPMEFVKTWKIGPDQLAIFITTVVLTLATDLLIGIGAGIVLKLVLHAIRGVPVARLFSAKPVTKELEDKTVITLPEAAIFSNWLSIKPLLLAVPLSRKLVLDCSKAVLIDHTVMEHLHELERERKEAGSKLELVGIERHEKVSKHPLAARRLPRAANLNPSNN